MAAPDNWGELKFGEVGGGSSRARRTLPRRGKPCQGQGKVNCVEPRTSLFLWLPLTRSRADVRARSGAESFAPQGQALSGAAMIADEKAARQKNHEKRIVFHGFLLFKRQK